MSRRILVWVNWLGAGLLSWVVLIAAFQTNKRFSGETWISSGVLLLLALGLLVILNGLRLWLARLSKRTTRWVLIGLLVLIGLIQLYVALNFVDGTQADSYMVRNQAINLAQGNHHWQAYFQLYPNNVNFTLFEAGFIKLFLSLGIKTPWEFLNILRFLWLDTALFSGLYLIKKFHRWQPGAIGLTLAWLCYTPLYFYGLVAYTDALVLPIAINVLALMWAATATTGWRRWGALVLSWLLLALGVVMKNNLVVFWIALAIGVLFAALQRRLKWSLSIEWLLGSIAIIMLSMWFMTGIASHEGYQKAPDKATPVTSWMAIGLNETSFGKYTTKDFMSVKQANTAAAKKQVAANLIHSRLKAMSAVDLGIHVSNKMGVFFAKGDFDATTQIAQWVKVPKWVMNRQRSLHFWLLLSTQSWYLMFLIGSIYLLLSRKGQQLAVSVFALMILGLTFFHVGLWEVSARYALPLLPILMILGVIGWSTWPGMALAPRQRKLISLLAVAGTLFSLAVTLQFSKDQQSVMAILDFQRNGSYAASSTTQLIKPTQQVTNHIPFNMATNQIRVYPTSTTGKVTIVLKNGRHELARRTGNPAQVVTLAYPRTVGSNLSLTIINRGKTPVSYYTALANFSQLDGTITSGRRSYLQHSLNLLHAPANLTSNRAIIVMLLGELLLVVLSSRLLPKPQRD